ncbi:MAG: hypothetical protein P0Y65_05885 [Candidatus Devosia phytovorans]|uniref:Chitin-binding type-3 domain-containing protein n=1 Tax=Candidatus Devosia phytovorans TaxID=3121372 RepID=A0AAJ5VVQ7_9HYPH|nr:hypothetical protein [Devosia sp.]WEK05786.1 MAG: hypothetical protein P0Y65_05885 [Devosia sp.]
MPLETWYSTGTVSVEGGSTTVTGTGLFWGEDAIMPGDLFADPAQPLVPPQRVKEVTGNAELELWAPWPGADMAADPYEIRYVGIIERSTAQTRKVLEQLGEISAYFDVQVNTLADRAAFDARPAGYRVLVSDVGDGRAEIFSKMSSVNADWSDGAPLGEIGPEGPRGPSGITWRNSWDSVTVYAAQDGVLYNGSSWRAKQASTNQAPPALPDIENTYWHLVSQAGANGTGTGDVVGPASSVSGRIALFSGTTGKLLSQAGLLITDLEPARTLATLAEAQAGTGTTTRGWTPQRIAQAILALSPPTDTSDLEFTVSQLAMLMADANNQAQFLGSNGNRFADSLDALTYVDVAGATNLDSSFSGLLKPSLAAGILIPRTTGIAIGNMTAAAGLSAAFDGATSQASGSCAGYTGVGTSNAAFIGKNYSASPQRISSAVVFGSNEAGLYAGADPAVVLNLRGKNGSAPTSATDGVLIGSLSFADTANESAGRTIVCTDLSTAWDYVFVQLTSNYAGNIGHVVAEVQFYPPGAPNNLSVRSAAFTAASVPARMKSLINVREVEAAVAGTDYLLDCSRDSGATWTPMALTERYTSGNLRVVETAETDVSGQPSGTSPRWRFRTLNNKNVELHDVYLYWS